jgi:hypothetical protein
LLSLLLTLLNIMLVTPRALLEKGAKHSPRNAGWSRETRGQEE